MPALAEQESDTSGALRMHAVACPRCGSDAVRRLHTGQDYLYGVPGDFHAAVCTGCGLSYQNPRPIDADLARAYPDHYGPHQAPASGPAEAIPAPAWRWIKAILSWPFRKVYAAARFVWVGSYFVYMKETLGYPQPCRRRPGWLSHAILPLSRRWCAWRTVADLTPRWVEGGRLLEIGCGSGWNMTRLRKLGWTQQLGTDLSSRAVAAVRAQGFDARCGPIEEILPEIPDASYDVVFSSMALEHLANPFEVIRHMAAKLRPGGQLLLSTVILDAIENRMHGKYGPAYDFPRHLVYFTCADLHAMLRSHFTRIELAHQVAPQDLVRPARWRRTHGEDRWVDRMVLRLENARILTMAHTVMAWRGLTTRVSVRCIKEGSP